MKRPLSPLGMRMDSVLRARQMARGELSRRSGVAYSTIAEWRSGDTRRPLGDSLLRVADALQVRPEWLLDGTGPRDLVDAAALSDQARQVAEYARQLPPGQLAALLDYLRALHRD